MNTKGDIKKCMEEGKFQEALEIIAELEKNCKEKFENMVEYKTLILAELGKLEEAKKYADTLPIESEVKKKILNFWQIMQNKPENPDETEVLKRLDEFGEKNGIYRKKASIAYFAKGYRGLIANSTINKGEVILRIPEKAVISTDVSLEGKYAKQVEKQLKLIMEPMQIAYPDYVFMTLFMFEERSKPDSIWKPYLESFTRDFSSFPRFYNEYEKLLCKGTCILKNNEKEMEEHKSIYDFLCQHVDKFINISFTEYLQLYTSLTLRVFEFPNKEGITSQIYSRALCPFLDLGNCKDNCCNQNDWLFDYNDRVIVVPAKEKIEIGEEIFIDYRLHDPEYILYDYGFTDDSLKSVGIEIAFTLSEGHSNYLDKMILVSSLFQKTNKIYKIDNNEGKIILELRKNNICELNKFYFQVLRLLLYKGSFDLLEKEFPCLKLVSNLKFSEFSEFSKFPLFFISIENELDVFDWLSKTLKDAMNNFHTFWNTSYDREKLNSNERNIEYIVKLEKKLCLELIEMVESGIQFIKSEFKVNPKSKYCGEFIYFYDGLKERIISNK